MAAALRGESRPAPVARQAGGGPRRPRHRSPAARDRPRSGAGALPSHRWAALVSSIRRPPRRAANVAGRTLGNLFSGLLIRFVRREGQ